ncbi:uncharacterized protein LOC114262079 isoform X3 [Camellia sinensis]|nr:uncharacterized protein LOC114262079 isoform X3 [Camellia sinensis]
MLDLSSLLCSEALHVESEIKVSSSLSDLTVAYSATKDQGSKSQCNSGFRGHKYSNYRGGSSTRGGRYVHRGHFNHRGGGRSAFSSHSFSQQPNPPPNSLICQICGKPNHTAIDCWCRMEASSSSSSAPKLAFIANASTSSPSASWYVDSAAITHVTPDLNNRQQYQPYHGSDHVTVGNGHSIPIQNTDQGQDYSDPSIQRGP